MRDAKTGRMVAVDAAERFWQKVDRRDGCWGWRAALLPNGYGFFWVRTGKQILAHRFAYELAFGPVASGLTLDHLCRNRACVNPAHLEPVTMRENVLRGCGLSAENARKTTCPRGHPYDAIYGGSRACKTCARDRARRRYAALRRTP